MTTRISVAFDDPSLDVLSIEKRFWSKVKVGDPSECWLWGAYCRDVSGSEYGSFGVRRGKMVLAHRLAYWFVRGAFDESLDILHRCDNPPCCNPDHLWIGTHTDNMRDMIQKNRKRAAIGEGHGRAKLTEDDVRRIRELYSDPDSSQGILAAQFGVTQTTIGCILRRKIWTHVN